jgi:hypothetical protein
LESFITITEADEVFDGLNEEDKEALAFLDLAQRISMLSLLEILRYIIKLIRFTFKFIRNRRSSVPQFQGDDKRLTTVNGVLKVLESEMNGFFDDLRAFVKWNAARNVRDVSGDLFVKAILAMLLANAAAIRLLFPDVIPPPPLFNASLQARGNPIESDNLKARMIILRARASVAVGTILILVSELFLPYLESESEWDNIQALLLGSQTLVSGSNSEYIDEAASKSLIELEDVSNFSNQMKAAFDSIEATASDLELSCRIEFLACESAL